MKNITIVSNARDCFIELTHRDSDPGLWIVQRWRKFIWFKKRISSDWFNDEHQAVAFAHEMKRKHDGEVATHLQVLKKAIAATNKTYEHDVWKLERKAVDDIAKSLHFE